MAPDPFTVPEGHQVVVVHPSDRPRMGRLQSGIVIVDYGNGENWRSVHTRLDETWAKRAASTLVILQESAIRHLRENDDFVQFFSDWERRIDGRASTVWVLPLLASSDAETIARIRTLGNGLHASAADGACFVEVQKPDGTIVVGMPGPAL